MGDKPVRRRSVQGSSRRRLLRLVFGAVALLIMLPLLGSPALAPVITGFPDVPASHPYHGAIMDLAGRGIIIGYTNGRFRAREIRSSASSSPRWWC